SSRLAGGRSAGKGNFGYNATLAGVGEPAGSVTSATPQSPSAAVRAVTRALVARASRPALSPVTVSPSASVTGRRNRAGAVPRASHASPRPATSGSVRYA